MKINAHCFGIAAAITLCSIYTTLSLALKFFPHHTLKFIGMIHMMPKLEYIKHFIAVTPQAIIIGMISHTLLVFVMFWLIAKIYNILQR